MDFLHEQGVRFIHLLQSHFTHQPSVDVFVELPQYLADPDTLMIFVFPLLLVFNRWLACRFALTIGVVDMINTVLKWMLQGERPYWWVSEVNQTTLTSVLPHLEQLPLTCESGPGSPSGHAMTSAAVGFVFISAVIDQHVHKKVEQSKRHLVESCLWFGYAFVVAFISIARLRLATHFPHQVVFGACAGMAGGWLVWNLPIERIRRKHFLTFALILFVWATVTYFGLQLIGVDPNRTLQLALKHCINRQYVKMSTTPWHSVYRNFALILATGLCSTTPLWTNIISQARFNLKEQISIALGSLVVAQTLASIPYPHQPVHIFYTCTILKNMSIVATSLLFVPLIVMYVKGSITIQQTVVTPVVEMPKRKMTAPSAMTIRQG